MSADPTDIMRGAPSADVPREGWLRRIGWARRVLAIVVVVSFAVAAFAWVRVVSSAFGALTQTPMSTPGSAEYTFGTGRYAVFERTGSQRGGGGITFTQNGFPELRPSDVTVTGPSGPVRTRLMDSNETINRNQAIYTGVVEFEVTEPGRYQVGVDRVTTEVIVTRRLFDGQASNLVLGLASGFVFVTAAGALVISSIVVGVRRRRPVRVAWASTAAAPPPWGTAAPPAWGAAPPAPPAGPVPPPPPPPPWRPGGP